MSAFRTGLGYVVAGTMLLLGALILGGFLLVPETTATVRWALGGGMILLGVYRSYLLYVERKESSHG
ncbi:MAG TPA: hypothetical protein DCX46_01205 [Bacteroidetes bacterium]|nr:hypothetical protein [Bacteroidota bacterium]